LECHSFTRLRDSIGWLHAEHRHEDSSILNLEKHPEVGHEMHYALYRDEFGEGILLRLGDRKALVHASSPRENREGVRGAGIPWTGRIAYEQNAPAGRAGEELSP
jgi:hypothetical protein